MFKHMQPFCLYLCKKLRSYKNGGPYSVSDKDLLGVLFAQKAMQGYFFFFTYIYISWLAYNYHCFYILRK